MLLALYEALFLGINLLMDEETEAQRGKGPCLNPTPAVSSVSMALLILGKINPALSLHLLMGLLGMAY